LTTFEEDRKNRKPKIKFCRQCDGVILGEKRRIENGKPEVWHCGGWRRYYSKGMKHLRDNDYMLKVLGEYHKTGDYETYRAQYEQWEKEGLI
jgi:hypothetical protein